MSALWSSALTSTIFSHLTTSVDVELWAWTDIALGCSQEVQSDGKLGVGES